MSVYAVGDIHGSYNALSTLFKSHHFSSNDTIVFLGDYVDKGKDSKKVIDWLIEHSEQYNFVFLKGNHEFMMLAARYGGRKMRDWMSHGGKKTMRSYNVEDDAKWIKGIPKEHWEFIETGKHYYETDSCVFVHAGLAPGLPLEKQSQQHLFWNKVVSPKYAHEKTVVCGHTSRKNGEIADFGHTVCIDTYAHGGKWLSCLNVDTYQFVQTSEKGKVQKGELVVKNSYIGSKIEAWNFLVSQKLILPSTRSFAYFKNLLITKNGKTASRIINS